jgi:hypothetical protein
MKELRTITTGRIMEGRFGALTIEDELDLGFLL